MREFEYIDAFCNRTKHTCDIYLKISLDLLGDSNLADINPFFRKDVQHNKQNIKTYLDDILNFITNSFNKFLEELKKEYPKKKYVNNRINKLYAYQQKLKNSPESNHSIVYIKATDKIENMPDEIFVVLLSKTNDEEFWSKNCEIDTILVQEDDTNYIGRYIADEPCGDDTLLRYRKYVKDNQVGHIVYIQEMINWKNNPIFYKFNPYIDIRTISDDKEFLNRIQCPI